ncbi:MAG: protease modulator HflK [Clostridia bacterium]|nr:protease modulator HflK [Clostridia bacterium]
MKGIKGRNLVTVVTLIFFCISLVAMNLYTRSNSSLHLHLFITSLFFGATNLLLISLKRMDIRRKKPKFLAAITGFFASLKRKKNKDTEEKPKKKVRINRLLVKKILRYFVYILVVVSCFRNVISLLTGFEKASAVGVGHAVTTAIILVLLLIIEKFCKHSENNSDFVSAMLKNCSLFIKLLSFQCVITIICTLLCAYEVFDVHKYAAYLLAVLFFYYLIFTVISLVVIEIKKTYATEPFIKIAVPFSDEDQSFNFVSYLENSTGITMRSLWSVKYIKKIAPVTLLLTVLLLWISTGIVQIEPYQEAAVYRFGALRDKTLTPGIHLVLPYPIDKTEIYDTDTVKKMTVGYKASEPTDNIWTSSHGSDEYKLLLGNGDELVSINLRLEYKISDLKKYLKSASSPELILEALAYELVTDKTITTDLSTLLSADREAFAINFQKELIKEMSEYDMGIEIVCVILESIHPPVEIASVYQNIVSAEITAERYILEAEAQANVKIAQAQAQKDTAVNAANAENSTKVAAAKSSVAEFLASLEMFNKYPNSYKYQKYLAAVREAYGKANLVILSDDVDSSAIYFGSFNSEPTVPETDDSAD